MKLFKKMKKGFTLIELVVVIAVIAVLSAVAVVTYISITNRAKESSDHAMIDQINTSVKASSILNKKHTVYDILEDLKEDSGFGVEKLKPELKDAEFVYSYSMNKFAYWKDNKVVYPDDVAKNSAASGVDLWFFKDVQSDSEEATLEAGKSFYVKSIPSTVTTLNVKGGVDLGSQFVKNVAYTNDSSAQSVVIRTTSYNTVLSIDAEHDTVAHYGKASKVDVTAVDNSHCYNEHGDIAGNINLEKGKVVVHDGCKAGAIVIDMTAAELATVTTLSADNSANKNVPIILNTSEVLWGANPHNGLINPTTNNIIYSSTGGTLPENFDSMTNEQKEAAIADASSSLVQGVAAIKNTGYATLQAAIEAAQNGDIIVLLDNITLSSSEGLVINKTITLNMNEKTITGSHDPLIVVGASELNYQPTAEKYTHSGHLTIRGNGSILSSNWDAICVFADASIELYDGNYSSLKVTIRSVGGLANIYGGNYTCTGTGVSYIVQLKNNASSNILSGNFTTGTNGCYGVFMDQASTLNLGEIGTEGPSFSTWRPCVATNGSLTRSCIINIYSGTYKANRTDTTIDDQAVLQIANASSEMQTLSIYGGYFEQTSHLENSCLITVKYGGIINITISGGTFAHGNNSKIFSGYGTNDSGYPSNSSTRVNVQNDAIPRNVTVEVYSTVSKVFTHLEERDFVVNQ